jgi:hypothetical protein
VLQNIGFALMQTYREYAEMTDWAARDAVKGLIRIYQAETRVRSDAPVPQAQSVDVPMTPKTTDEIIACLKTITSSIELWQKELGRRGYFDFVNQFVK